MKDNCGHRGYYHETCDDCKDRYKCFSNRPGYCLVNYIQVGGAENCNTLLEACQKYIETYEEIDRHKIHLEFKLPDGGLFGITIREEGGQTRLYGTLPGLPDFIDYAKFVQEEP